MDAMQAASAEPSAEGVVDLSRSVSNRFQIFDQVFLFFVGQFQPEMIVIVLYHVRQRWETTIMVETTFVNLFRVPERTQRHGIVSFAGGTHGLEVVNTNLVRLVRVPA